MPQFAGMSVREYKRTIEAATLRYLNEYRSSLGLEPVDNLGPKPKWWEVLRSLRDGR